jgi:hypothetical protein
MAAKKENKKSSPKGYGIYLRAHEEFQSGSDSSYKQENKIVGSADIVRVHEGYYAIRIRGSENVLKDASFLDILTPDDSIITISEGGETIFGAKPSVKTTNVGEFLQESIRFKESEVEQKPLKYAPKRKQKRP